MPMIDYWRGLLGGQPNDRRRVLSGDDDGDVGRGTERCTSLKLRVVCNVR
jgi:hypothetical protein